ncbi:LysR substrate-binding domain-containing protein [Bradyrhizobium guangdongense]|uniref:LysR substrate-binding domain-containing protein n=1 Tax=Bradyrhizobium guangdongense TaxID=1325090 RepID=UPI001FEF64E0|nr:LysR substrate-binding domain-containing protein [Bradyrhizobium guangdongense]
MPIELRHLRYFTVVAAELSFTAAARRLHISQPPLSQQIRDLEHQVGAALFQRTSRRVRLTAAGDSFLVHARAILAQVDSARREAQAIGAGKTGRLLIGTTGSILRSGLADLLAAHRHEYPEVTSVLIEQAPALQIRALQERSADISFIRLPPAVDGLVATLAWKEDVVLAMSRIHRLANRKRLALRDLRDEEFVALVPESSDFARSIQESCVSAGFLPRVAHEVVDAQSIVGLVSAGFGVALVPASISRFTNREILFRRLTASNLSADVYIVRRDEDHSQVVKTFIDFSRKFVFRRAPG